MIYFIKYWKFGIIFLLAGLLFAGKHYYENEISKLEAEKNELIAKKQQLELGINLCNQINTALGESVDVQNEMIRKFKLDADERVKKHQTEIEQARKRADDFRKQAGDLMNKKPDPNKTACENANGLINEEIIKNNAGKKK